jgi:hypothetical protein
VAWNPREADAGTRGKSDIRGDIQEQNKRERITLFEDKERVGNDEQTDAYTHSAKSFARSELNQRKVHDFI